LTYDENEDDVHPARGVTIGTRPAYGVNMMTRKAALISMAGTYLIAAATAGLAAIFG